MLFDGDGRGTVAVLEGLDGLDDISFVRHGDGWSVGGVKSVNDEIGSVGCRNKQIERG